MKTKTAESVQNYPPGQLGIEGLAQLQMVAQLDREARKAIFARVLPFIGKQVSAQFLKRTQEVLPGIERIHPLIEGIYKPKHSPYALSVRSSLGNPYDDRIEFSDNGSWVYFYSAKSDSLDAAINASLFKCMRDGEPVIVLMQTSDKSGPNKTQYRFHGLGKLEHFDPGKRLFRVKGMQIEEIQDYLGEGKVMEDGLIDTAIQLEALEAWQRFQDPNRTLYKVSKEKRDRAFRKNVLGNYERTCAVTGQQFNYDKVTEAQAAHIIGKNKNGTDDPRNGIALSHSIHWAFDKGIFTITDQYEVLIHPIAKKASVQNFVLFELDRKPIQLPKEDYYRPHPDALQWHRDEVFGKFAG